MTALSAYKYIYHIHTCMCPQGSEAWGVAAPHSLVLELQRVVNCHVNTGIQIHVLSRANSALTCWFISPAFCPLHGNLNNHFPRNKKKKNSWNSYGAMVWMWLSLLGSCLGGGGACRAQGLTDRRQVIRGHLESTSVLCFTLPTLLLFQDSYRWEAVYFMGGQELVDYTTHRVNSQNTSKC